MIDATAGIGRRKSGSWTFAPIKDAAGVACKDVEAAVVAPDGTVNLLCVLVRPPDKWPKQVTEHWRGDKGGWKVVRNVADSHGKGVLMVDPKGQLRGAWSTEKTAHTAVFDGDGPLQTTNLPTAGLGQMDMAVTVAGAWHIVAGNTYITNDAEPLP